MNCMYIPDEAVRYILFQRTGYIKYAKGKLFSQFNKYSPWSFYQKAVTWEAARRKEEIKDLYHKDIFGIYNNIKAHLPAQCDSVLDIGCGIAGIDLFLFRHYQPEKAPQVYLLDKTSVDQRVYYNYKPRGSFYNSLSLASEMLTANGVPAANIHLLEATDDNRIDIQQELTLVISLISWGFHYPLSTYLDRVYELLNENGRLIIDVRKNTGALEELRRKFATVTPIAETRSSTRLVAVR